MRGQADNATLNPPTKPNQTKQPSKQPSQPQPNRQQAIGQSNQPLLQLLPFKTSLAPDHVAEREKN
jgi:hypothetical protein